MQKIINKLIKITVFSLIILTVFTDEILAITCDYPSAELSITYDENTKPQINSNFVKSNYYLNFLILGWGSNEDISPQVDIDQNLWEKYGGVCPTQMHVCTQTRYGIDLPNLKSLAIDIGHIATNVSIISLFVSDEHKTFMAENGWKFLNVGQRTLYVLTDEEYENYLDSGELKPNGRNGGSMFYDNWEDAAKGCSGTGLKVIDGIGWFVCGLVGGAVFDIGDILGIGNDTDYVSIYDTECQMVSYNGPYSSINVNCAKLATKKVEYGNIVDEYKECGDSGNCKSQAITKLNEIEENIKSQCTSILRNYSYQGGQSECIDSCLTIKSQLNKLKEGTDLYDDGILNEGECGFSGRLLAWVNNIMKWIKYIAPVLVIVLGILDFIKAIGSDKDDEMKKAQGRFMRRLIAAAIIFLVPFIIEFILTKMGFTVYGCGIKV